MRRFLAIVMLAIMVVVSSTAFAATTQGGAATANSQQLAKSAPCSDRDAGSPQTITRPYYTNPKIGWQEKIVTVKPPDCTPE